MALQKRVVVKLGTQVVIDQSNGAPVLPRLEAIVRDIARLRSSGIQAIVVSSGAVGMGRAALGFQGALSLPEKQACAAVGQSRLMALYEGICASAGMRVAQVLVTAQDFTSRSAYLNLRSSCDQLLSLGVLPIVNENDVVSTAGIRDSAGQDVAPERRSFDDNDKLSALVAGKLLASTLVILTNVDGVYTANPQEDPGATRIARVGSFAELAAISCSGRSMLGRGGMASKLEAAKIAALCGVRTVIASAAVLEPVIEAVAGRSGTTVDIQGTGVGLLSGRERWIALASGFSGVVTVNRRAREILERGTSSLLPVGVLRVEGDFGLGEVVSIIDELGEEFGRGLASQRSSSARRVAGLRTDSARPELASDERDELVHRDDLVIFSERPDAA